MNTDKSTIANYMPGLPAETEREIRKWLSDAPEAAVEAFLNDVTHEEAMCRARAQARSQAPDGKDQNRYLLKLKKNIERTGKVLVELDDILTDAPAELRQAAREAGTEVGELQIRLTSLVIALNELNPSKSRERPEMATALRKTAESFTNHFGKRPNLKAVREEWDIPRDAPLEDRFIPVAALLLSRSVDHISRLARKNLPS